MVISDHQKDAITELINIGFSKSAASLSELTGYRILLSVPEVKVIPIDELASELKDIVPDNISTVHQVFYGTISGDAMLIMSQKDSQTLTQLLLNEPEKDIHSEATIREVLTEVGNILLNSCLGMFGNILKVQITFSVPQLQLETLDKLIRTLTTENNELSYAMMVTMEFHLRDKSISGFLVLVLGVTSLDKFLEEIEKLG